MKKFIVNYLMTLIHAENVSFRSDAYAYGTNDGSVVRIFGKIRAGLADLSITRLRPDGTAISSIPVFGMPLGKDAINNLADFAIESL